MMTSQVNLDKKRIAHIGNKKNSNDKNSPFDEDIVSEIINSMESKKCISYKQLQELRERHNLHSPNPEVTAPEGKSTKKYLLHKKHPLMAKCQKNLKYLKHNRCVPKQRAHIGEIGISKNICEKVNLTTNSNTCRSLNEKKKLQKKKPKIISKKVKKLKFSPQNKEEKSELNLMSKSMDEQEVQVLKDSSDSECEFEEFIREQKELLDCEQTESEQTDSEIESSCSKRKKKKHKMTMSNRKKSKSSINKRAALNCLLDEASEESDFEMNESFSLDSDSCETAETTPNLESDINSKNSICGGIESNLSLDLTKSDTKDYISKNFSCSVRLERNPILEEKFISALRKETSKNDEALTSNKNPSICEYDVNEKSLKNPSSPSGFNSDEDECMIICEIPRSNSTCTVSEKSGESALYKDNLSLTGLNRTSYSDLGFDLQDENSQQSKISPEIDVCMENVGDSVVNSDDESEIQILSVETLNTDFKKTDYLKDHNINSEEQKQTTLNINLKPVMQNVSNLINTDYSENKTTYDPKLSQKDFFKYAKTYSEPQNLIGNNAEIIPGASKTSDVMSDSEINKCLNKIDLNLINSTLKQVDCSETFINKCDNAESLESTKHMDSNCDKNINELSTNQIINDACVKGINPLPSHIVKIAQKIDFKEILSLTKHIPNETTENTCNMKSLKKLSKNTESGILDSSHKSVISTNAINSRILSPNEPNNKQEKLALLHRFSNQSAESCSQKLNQSISELTDSFKTKVENFVESPSDELDVIATANILNLNEQKSKDFIPLFNLYKKELTKYKKIKSAEQNVSEGLKMLEETQFEKLKYLNKAIQSVLQHDPCSLKIIEKAKSSKTESSVKGNNSSLSKQTVKEKAEICNNCGLLAKLKCLGCEKVFFCSEKCGLQFWKDGHVYSCQKDVAQVKIEN